MFSTAVRFGRQLEVLEDAAHVAAEQRHLRALEPAQVAPADDDPCRRSASSSLRISRMTVDLPEPDAPTTNTNSPLSIVKETPSSAVTPGS